MNTFFQNNKIVILGAVVGAIAGFLYWNFIGCSTGSCAITSKPFNSSIYGAFMGGVFFSMFKKDKNKIKE
ncbi:DUF6132 family protein [Chryseobacterium sp. POL2]|uniref:DUF6132 family protein n=1 Tax=Chryseobacterium sp. POL2 TaxID=2713414 RepID=UPI0013E131DD|nr:DUF6132 family protein [Chryseobacterium sp. POL2]QIG89523.1 hypothetical protein G6R40_07525 [Chryseobacterium sp. POL2]